MTNVLVSLDQLQQNMPFEQIDDMLAHGLMVPEVADRLLFLDVDGVLNNTSTRIPDPGDEADEFLVNGSIDDECLARLKNLLDEIPDTKIVVSSSWRKDVLLMRVLNRRLGLHSSKIIASTPIFNHGFRGLEIEHFLYTNYRDKTITMCIVDDDGDFFPHQKQFHVQTDFDYGMTKTIAYRVKQRLLHSKRTIE